MDTFRSLKNSSSTPNFGVNSGKRESIYNSQPLNPEKRNTNSNPRLKLKDYLRLNNIKKKKSASTKLEAKSGKTDIQENLQILQEELKNEISSCFSKLSLLMKKTEKLSHMQNKSQQQQLVFLCDFHRKIKENIETNIQRSLETLENCGQEEIHSEVLSPKVYANKKARAEKAFLKNK